MRPARPVFTKVSVDRVQPTEQPAPTPISPAGNAAISHKNPYVGPRSLQSGEKIYGRDREARQLLDLLIAERIVLLYSPSGAGKTSLIQAGLVPELRKEDFEVLPVIRVGQDAAKGRGLGNRYVLSTLLSLEEHVSAEEAIPMTALSQMSIADYLTTRESGRASGNATFLIFDQFEEILTANPLDQEAKTEFFNQVGTALRDLKRWALFSMREDHVAALDPYLRLIPTRMKATFRLDLLNADMAREAIEKPAAAGGVSFTESATSKLVDDLRQVSMQDSSGATVQVAGPHVEPVQLQVVCFRMWEKLPPGTTTITEELLLGSSDVNTALAEYYGERVRAIATDTGEKERVIREWCGSQLITESGLRGQVMEEPEKTGGLGNRAIELLINAHLVRGEQRRGVTWLELAHDRMVRPVQLDNAKWFQSNLSLLQRKAALWDREGKPMVLSLRDDELAGAQVWAGENAAELNESEREFLAVSLERQTAKVREAKLRRLVAAGAACALMIMALLAVFAFRQASLAKTARDLAERQRVEAEARSIAADVPQFADDRLDLALLLATEANRMKDMPETRRSLLQAAFHNPRLTTFLRASVAPVSAVAFSPDGSRLATGDFDGSVVLWDVKTRRPLETLTSLLGDAVRSIAFSPDGKYLAVGGKGGAVVLRDLQTGAVKRPPVESALRGNAWSLAFSDDSTLLVSGGDEGKINVWNVASGNVVTLFSDPDADREKRSVRAVAIHPAGQWLAAGCSDGAVIFWKRQGETWTPLDRALDEASRRHERVTCLAFSPDGKFLATGRRSSEIELYDLASPAGKIPLVATGKHDGIVSGLAVSADSGRIISSSFDGTLRLWKTASLEPVGSAFTGHVGRVLCVAFSADNHTVASGGTDRSTILWDTWLRVSEPVRAAAAEAKFRVALNAGATIEATSYEDGKMMLKIRDEKGWRPAATIQPRPGPSNARRAPMIAFSGDGRVLMTGTAQGTLRLYDVTATTPPLLAEFDVTMGDASKRITALALSRDATLIAACVSKSGAPAQIFAWRVATREPLFSGQLSAESDDVFFSVAFSPDGTRLVTGGDAEAAVIWTLADKSGAQRIRCPSNHTGAIRCVVFSPDGASFVTASSDNTLLVWNAETGRQIGPPLTGHRAPVIAAAFSPDGALLASGSDDQTLILWDVSAARAIGQLVGHSDSVRALAYAADGKSLYSASWDEETNVWELDPQRLQDICRDRANRNLTGSEWTAYVRDGPYRKTWPGLPAPGDWMHDAP